MKRLFLATSAALAIAGASSAWATVNVLGVITFTKDVAVVELLNVVKVVDLNVVVVSVPNKFAEGEALVNQTNITNSGCFNCAEKADTITASANGNSGIFNINQSSGNMNNQATAVALSVDVRVPPTPGPTPTPEPIPGVLGFAEAAAGGEQINVNSIDKAVDLFFKVGTISGSFNAAAGIINGNQAPGNMNNQMNSISQSVAFAVGGVALSEADLGQFNIGNKVFEANDPNAEPGVPSDGVGINKAGVIVGSINGTAGIVGVNQAVGNFANQANVVAFAAVILP